MSTAASPQTHGKQVTVREPKLEDCEVAVHATDHLSTSDLLTYYGQIRDYIEHEDGLINSRLTWSLTVHAFLFAGFGVLAQRVTDAYVQAATLPAVIQATSPQHTVVVALLTLQLMTAIIGVFVGLFSGIAIFGAHQSIQHLYSIAHHTESLRLVRLAGAPADSLLLPKILGGGAPIRRTILVSPYYLCMPFVFGLVWVIVAGVSAFFLHEAFYSAHRFFAPWG
jgi:hypothetical protein